MTSRGDTGTERSNGAKGSPTKTSGVRSERRKWKGLGGRPLWVVTLNSRLEGGHLRVVVWGRHLGCHNGRYPDDKSLVSERIVSYGLLSRSQPLSGDNHLDTGVGRLDGRSLHTEVGRVHLGWDRCGCQPCLRVTRETFYPSGRTLTCPAWTETEHPRDT